MIFYDFFSERCCVNTTYVVFNVEENYANGQFHNCQSWSFIAVHGRFQSNGLEIYCQVTIWPSIYNRMYILFVINLITWTMDFSKCGRILKICGTMHLRFVQALRKIIHLKLYLNTAFKKNPVNMRGTHFLILGRKTFSCIFHLFKYVVILLLTVRHSTSHWDWCLNYIFR